MFKMEEEGHYTIKRVNKLPKKGNANWLYTIKGSSINKFYRWKGIDEGYETILVGEEGVNKIEAGENVTILGTGSLADPYIINALDNFEPTDLSTDYGIDLSPVAISNDYNDLDNTPIFKVVENEYENLSEMYADQANQTNTFIQYVKDVSRPPDIFSGDGYFEYLGTTIGNLEDYRILSEEEAAPISTSVTRTSELLNDGQDGINPFTTSQDLPTSTQQLINEGADGTDTYVEFKDLPTSTQQLINEGADGTDTYVEFKDLPTVAKEGLSVQDTNGTEQFKVDDFIKFKGVVFDGAEKQVSITSLRFNTIFLSTTGDDGNFEENSKLRPARTLDAVWDYLYTQPEKGFGWTIYILSSGTFTLTRYNQALKGFNIYNETGATISIESYFNVTDQWIFNFPKGKLRFRRTDDSQLLGTFKNSLTLSVKHDIDEVEFVNDSTGELFLDRQAIRKLCVNSSFNYINWKTLTIQQGGWNIFDSLLGDKVKVKIDTLINNTTVHGKAPTIAVHNLELGTYINNTTVNHRIDAKVGTIKEVISNSAFVGIRINNLMLTEDLYLTNAFLDVSQAGYNILEGNGYQINVNTNLSDQDIFLPHVNGSGKDTAFGYSRTIANYIKNVRFNVEAGSLTPRFTRADLRADVRIGNQFILENVEVNSTDPLILLEIQNHFGNFADYQIIFRGVCKILNKTHLLVSGISGIVSQDLLVSENATIIHDFGQISSNSNIQTNIPNKGIQTSDDIREGNTNKFAKLNGTEISIGDTNVTELKIGETLVIDKSQIVTGVAGVLVTKKVGGKTIVEVTKDNQIDEYSLVGYQNIINEFHSSESDLARIDSTTILMAYRYDISNRHVSNNSSIRGRISNDNGLTWNDSFEIFNSIYDDRNIVLGNLGNGDLIIVFRQFDDSTSTGIDTGYIKSSDGVNWSPFVSLSITGSSYVPFGKIVNRVNEDVFLLYGANTIDLVKSNDNFNTNVSISEIINETTTSIVEPFLEDIGDGKSIILTRNTNKNIPNVSFFQYNSIDGENYLFKGATNILDDLSISANSPVSIRYIIEKDELEVCATERHAFGNYDVANLNDNLVIYRQNALDVFNNQNSYIKKHTLPMPVGSTQWSYGYPSYIKVGENKTLYSITDSSISDVYRTPLSNLNNEFAEIFNFSIYENGLMPSEKFLSNKVVLYNKNTDSRDFVDFKYVDKTDVLKEFTEKKETNYLKKCASAPGSVSTENGANTWGKFAEFKLSGTNPDVTLNFHFISARSPLAGSANVMFSSRGSSIPTLKVAITSIGLNNSPFSKDSFKIGYNTSSQKVECWVKKNIAFQNIDVYEIIKKVNGFLEIDYFNNFPWQSSTPNFATESTSKGIEMFSDVTISGKYKSENDVEKTAVTLNNSNVSSASLDYTVKNNRLIVIGSFTSSASANSNLPVFNVPIAYRPSQDRRILAQESSSNTIIIGLLSSSSGNLSMDLVPNTVYYLDFEITIDLD